MVGILQQIMDTRHGWIAFLDVDIWGLGYLLSTMKYVALLSGGKDSCYNLLHCAKNGHQLIAAASLGPESGKEELDSYLYQTVGQDAIEFVARALDVPLYRQVITGGAVEQGSEYGDRKPTKTSGVQGDETEDLFQLLSTVKSHHSDIQGVSVGAILSNYQRVRVEHVCRRLGLTPLCYLWNRDQKELLAEMIDAGLNAVIIKVAGIGLTTEHLGKTLAEIQGTLIKLNDLYGAHICGEGGEYETLTLDCPMFKHRISLTNIETVIHSDNHFATVAFLRIKSAALEPKPPYTAHDVFVPSLLEDDFVPIRDAVLLSQKNSSIAESVDHLVPDEATRLYDQTISAKSLDSWISVTNIQRNLSIPIADISIEDEVIECFHTLQDHLARYTLDLSHCTNINIFISSIELFPRINAAYSTFFGTSPPARACVAVDLPHPIRVRLDCTAFSESAPTDRQALHVQSLSYWAPANIGPYSQAITVADRVFISGQIGLIPGSLVLPSPESLSNETALASQHVARIIDALRNGSGGGWRGHVQTSLYWLTSTTDLEHVKTAHKATKSSVHEPTLFLVVKDLPKNALIEKQVFLHTGRCTMIDEDDGGVQLLSRVPTFEQNHLNLADGGEISWEISRLVDASSACALICIRGGEASVISSALMAVNGLESFWDRSLSIRLFYVPSRAASSPSIFNGLYGHHNQLPTIIPIPCRFISTGDSDDWDYVMCILSV